MKKFLALLLALVMSLSLVACGGGDDTAADGGADAEDGGNAETAAYQVAMITDYGDITDQSFNQTTYEACQEFCDAEGLQFEYYKPAGDSTAERVAMVDAAVADGYNVIVMLRVPARRLCRRASRFHLCRKSPLRRADQL